MKLRPSIDVFTALLLWLCGSIAGLDTFHTP